MKTLFCFCFIINTLFPAAAQIGKKLNKKPETSALAGTWVHTINNQDITLLFYDNGTGEFEGEAISFETANGKLALKNGNNTITYGYILNGNQLTLSGGDLSKPATFIRAGSGVASQNQPAQNVNAHAGKELLGTWTTNGGQFTFMSGGKMLYNDKSMNYTVNGNMLYCSNAEAGVEVTYEYAVNQNRLTLSYNGNTLTLQKAKGGAAGKAQNNTPANNYKTQKPAFLGSWVSTQNNQLTMMEGGKLTLDGYDLNYTFDAHNIILMTTEGNMTFSYTISGDQFNVTYNGVTTYYRRVKNGAANGNKGGADVNAAGGKIDQTMVGKWSRMGASGGGYNSSGSSQYSESFTLYANGTYEYYGESSRSASANNQYGEEVIRGGASNDGADRGTWRVKGNTIIAVSKNSGTHYYRFEKRNNKNGDPCIVLDGTEYVTYYKKSPW